MRDDMGREVVGLSKEELKEINPPEVLEGKGKIPGGILKGGDIKRWMPIHTRILILMQKGMTLTEISKQPDINYSTQWLIALTKTPSFRLKLAKFNDKMDLALLEKATEDLAKTPQVELAKMKLIEAAEDAADILLKLMNPNSAITKRYSIHERRLMCSIAQDILDRAGLKSAASTEDTTHRREYSPEEIKSALDNAKELEQIGQRLAVGGSSYVMTSEQRKESDGQAVSDTIIEEASFTEPVGQELQ